jgi:hypothetical protein
MRSTLERSNAGATCSAFRRTSHHLLRIARRARAGIASLMSIAAAALCAPQPAEAAQILVTVTGSVSSGNDLTGVFVGVGANLKGYPFTLTYIFDDIPLQARQVHEMFWT